MKAISFEMTPALRKRIDNLIRAAIGPKVAVEGALDRRYSNRKGDAEKKIAAWTAYERYLLSSGHTVYVSLANPNEPKVTVSEKVDKHAQAKVEKRAARAERKATRLAAKAAVKAKAKPAVKAEPKAKQDIVCTPPVNVIEEPKAVKPRKSKFDAGDEARIQAIISERKCTRSNALKQLNNEKAVAAADAQAKTPLASIA